MASFRGLGLKRPPCWTAWLSGLYGDPGAGLLFPDRTPRLTLSPDLQTAFGVRVGGGRSRGGTETLTQAPRLWRDTGVSQSPKTLQTAGDPLEEGLELAWGDTGTEVTGPGLAGQPLV